MAAHYIGCEICGRAAPFGQRACRRCGAHLPRRGRRSFAAVWVWLGLGLAFYIPANLYPMLITTNFGKVYQSTIVGGAIDLAAHGSWGVAGIVFFASVVIPIAKFLAIGRLGVMAAGGAPLAPHAALRLYEVVEFIGRWSMIDVFVVAILSALVRMGMLANVAPGPAAALFALSVGATMLSARAFDQRLIWDRIGAADG
ncbi:paraquat-inducible membrane protein A [Pikeienuella piscinae]|uniref:Paraquat-inducible membrane protein A n=1 Tax=Pikeienuella piscinae TaxID=2748098 RepID=A0A7M3T768_9RHOB|nr:paraquat-inducible membrane protein A [Pikeienuella piscinae]